jgi:hypothetical protein
MGFCYRRGVAGAFLRRTVTFLGIAVVLLGTLAAEEWLSIGRLLMTFDKGAHLYAGYQHWRAADFGVNPEHPPLVKLVASALLLGLPLHQPDPPGVYFLAEEYGGGSQLLQANDGELLPGRAGWAASLFTFALALLICAAAGDVRASGGSAGVRVRPPGREVSTSWRVDRASRTKAERPPEVRGSQLLASRAVCLHGRVCLSSVTG